MFTNAGQTAFEVTEWGQFFFKFVKVLFHVFLHFKALKQVWVLCCKPELLWGIAHNTVKMVKCNLTSTKCDVKPIYN